MPILVADLWLLGDHHVVSTFARPCFDAGSFRQYRFFVTGLPLIVLLSLAALTYVGWRMDGHDGMSLLAVVPLHTTVLGYGAGL